MPLVLPGPSGTRKEGTGLVRNLLACRILLGKLSVGSLHLWPGFLVCAPLWTPHPWLLIELLHRFGAFCFLAGENWHRVAHRQSVRGVKLLRGALLGVLRG